MSSSAATPNAFSISKMAGSTKLNGWGIEFPNGQVVVQWTGDVTTLVTYSNVADFSRINGMGTYRTIYRPTTEESPICPKCDTEEGKGWTVRDVCRGCGVASKTITTWETKPVEKSVDKVQQELSTV